VRVRSSLSALVLSALLLTLAVSVAAKDRKLQPDTYIRSAKIEILSGEEVRIQTAIAMLDSLFMYYGPHAEGLYWRTKIEAQLMESAKNLDSRVTHLATMMVYTDSLRKCCDNKDVKAGYRKGCDSYMSELDSARVLLWRSFYNDAVDKVDEVKEAARAVKEETDSAMLESFRARLSMAVDSVKSNMLLAMTIDSSDARSYIGIASAYEYAGDYPAALTWMTRALPLATDKDPLLIKIAYLHIELNDYCAAIPYFHDYSTSVLADSAVMADSSSVASLVGTLYNLTICLNNCKQFDSAFAVEQVILKYDPVNVDALNGSGLYHNEMARMANDSANAYRDAGNDAKEKEWRGRKEQEFEAAKICFKKVFDLKQEDVQVAEQYGIVSAVLEEWGEAAIAFARAVALDSTRSDDLVSLGDSHLRLGNWQDAATAYRKAVELKPDAKDVWLNLEALYKQLGDQAGLREAQAKLKTF
jgi:tetratricopeptide (TPR) repeat protein